MTGIVVALSMIFSYAKNVLEVIMYVLICLACIKYIRKK